MVSSAIEFLDLKVSEEGPGVALVLWDSPNAPDGLAHGYTWSGYDEDGNMRSLLRYVEANGERLRRIYLDWIHGLGEARIAGRRLIDRFAYRDGLSYWWMTTIVEKSPWKSPAIMDAVRLLALEEIVLREQPARVRLTSANRALNESVRLLCGQLGVDYQWSRLPEAGIRTLGARAVYRVLPPSVQAVFQLAKHAVSRWSLRRAASPVWFEGERAIFFCSYFIHLDRESCERGRFYSRHWEELPRVLHAHGRPTNWLQQFLVSSVVPNTATAARWSASFNRSRGSEGVHTFLDQYLSWAVLLRVMTRYISLSMRAWRLGEVSHFFRPSGSHCSFWPLLRNDWRASMYGPAAIQSLLWIELFDKALKEVPVQHTGLYLYENQGWERAFVHAWRKHGHGRLVGVAHSTVRFWDLRYFPDSRQLLSRGDHAMPAPDLVALNGEAAMAACRSANLPASVIVGCEALRYGYHGRGKGRGLGRSMHDPLRVLVLTDFAAGATLRMMRLLEQAAERLPFAAKWVVKPHPSCPVRAEDYPTLPLSITTEPLERILDDVDVAFASNNTSAAVDAYLSGMPVSVVLDRDELNFSPLRNRPGVRFVGSPGELATALESARRVATTDPVPQEFFFLDAGLARWKGLLGLSVGEQ